MGFEIKGFDEMQRKLEGLQKRVASLEGTNRVSFSELFDHGFLAQHSRFASFSELLDAGGFVVNSQEDFKAIPDDDFDKHIAANTDFNSWKETKQAAATAYFKKQLGF